MSDIPDWTLPMDLVVASRIREARMLCGLSQGALGTAAGVSFQQAQKWESGKNRISAGRLHAVATVLQTPIEWFFGPGDLETPDMEQRRTYLELARYFGQMNRDEQRLLFDIARVIAQGANSKD